MKVYLICENNAIEDTRNHDKFNAVKSVELIDAAFAADLIQKTESFEFDTIIMNDGAIITAGLLKNLEQFNRTNFVKSTAILTGWNKKQAWLNSPTQEVNYAIFPKGNNYFFGKEFETIVDCVRSLWKNGIKNRCMILASEGQDVYKKKIFVVNRNLVENVVVNKPTEKRKKKNEPNINTIDTIEQPTTDIVVE